MRKIKIPFNTESVNDDAKTIDFVLSTNDVDRENEVVNQDWKLDGFMENPVVLNSHHYEDATEAIGKIVELTQKPDVLEGRVKFAVNENPKAKTIYELYKGGFLNAVSVSFAEAEEKLNELLEVSAVTVPANMAATAKSKGIDLEPIEKEIEKNTKDEIDKLFQGKAKVLSQARTPHYDGTETVSWGDVDTTMEAYLNAYPGDTEDVSSVDNMDAELKKWIVQKSLLGEATADTFAELSFFPVVNPNTKNLNKGALEAIRGGRGQSADIPKDSYNSASQKAKNLLEKEFDVDYSEESYSVNNLFADLQKINGELQGRELKSLLPKVKEGRVLSDANKGKVKKALKMIKQLHKALEALLATAEKSETEETMKVENEQKIKKTLNELHKKVDKQKKKSKKRKAHKVIRELKNKL